MGFGNDDVSVSVGGDVVGLERAMKRGRASMKGFDTDAERMGVKLAKAGGLIATALAGIGVAGAAMMNSAANAATEIKRASDLAGVSAESFQLLAAGAQTVGIEQEKLADIFKDVNDKFGDFMANGAGPLKDFFDNIAPAVGVTAEQFARLSGPEALQLYVESLEKAGVSQQQMTFYMEALASDTTALLPLLRNGGDAMNQLGNEAARAGRILSNDAVDGGAELDRKMQELSDTIRTQLNAALLENADEIGDLVDDVLPLLVAGLNAVVEVASGVAKGIGEVTKAIGGAVSAVENFHKKISDLASASGMTIHDLMNVEPGGVLDRLIVAAGGSSAANAGIDQTGLGLGPTTRGGKRRGKTPEAETTLLRSSTDREVVDYAPPPLLVPLVNTSATDTSGGGGGGGSGFNSAGYNEFEAMQERFADEADLVQQKYAEDLERLREFRESKVATEQEFNDLEAKITAEHQEKITDLERKAQAARLSAIGSALGDLGSLMQSENEKLFKVGKAAKVAEAVMSGISASIAAWEKGMKIGGPPVAGAFAAASALKTGAMIASLQSSTSSSTSASSGGAVASTGATVSEPQERRYAEFRFVGGNVLDPSAIVDAMNDAYDQGYQIKGVLA